ncbi:MAG: DUF664 domain-containing protein [Acidimicrobiales bacterium]
MTEWAAPTIERTEPDRVAGERKTLEQWLDFHRLTLLQKCEGLTAAQLKQRAVSPSRLSLLGIVRHMADVERWWLPDACSPTGHRLPLRSRRGRP